MENQSEEHFPSPNSPLPIAKPKGRIHAKHLKVAAMIARGYPISVVAERTGLSQSRIYHLLSDADSLVNYEANRILNELFSQNDRTLLNLYLKTLVKLDEDLSSDDPSVRSKAIDQVIKVYLARTGKSQTPTVAQYITVNRPDSAEFMTSIDQLIIEKRRERGLPLNPGND